MGVACDWEARAETVEEIMAQAAEHAKKDHGMTDIPPDLIEKAKQAIKDE
jgi:predicted small metal-binding protein